MTSKGALKALGKQCLLLPFCPRKPEIPEELVECSKLLALCSWGPEKTKGLWYRDSRAVIYLTFTGDPTKNIGTYLHHSLVPSYHTNRLNNPPGIVSWHQYFPLAHNSMNHVCLLVRMQPENVKEIGHEF